MKRRVNLIVSFRLNFKFRLLNTCDTLLCNAINTLYVLIATVNCVSLTEIKLDPAVKPGAVGSVITPHSVI